KLQEAALWSAYKPQRTRSSQRNFIGNCTSVVLCSGRLLVQTDHVPSGVTKPGGDLGSIGPNGLHNFSSGSDNLLQGRRHAVHHHINEDSGGGGGRPTEHPGATHFPYGIIEGDRAIAALAQLPTQRAMVELGRTGDVGGRNLEIADFSVGK